MATQTLMTGEQFDQLPTEDERRWELIDGELIEMARPTARHNRVLANLLTSLLSFCERTSLGVVLTETEFAFGPSRRFRPDLVLFSAEAWATIGPDSAQLTAIPLIAVEVISPSESAIHLERKVRAYLEAGVSAVLLLYPDFEAVYVHQSGGVKRLSAQELLALDMLPGWSVSVGSLFKWSIA